MILAANDVGDPHFDIVDGRSEVVGRCPVGSCNDEVLDLGVVEANLTAHHVLPGGRARQRNRKPPDRSPIFGCKARKVIRRPVPAATNDWRFAILARRLTLRVEFLISLVGRVDGARGLESFDGIEVDVRTFTLSKWPLVPVDSDPGKRAQNLGFALGCRAFTIGVLKAQNHRSAAPTGDQPVEERRSSTAHMERAGRARSKAHSGR